ncbi:MAG: amidase [Actinomycetota bacterium]
MTVSFHTFTDDALGTLDAVGVAAAIAGGEVSATEVMDAAIARADQSAPVLNATVERIDDRARAGAAAAQPTDGVFAGVPTFIKDTDPVDGLPNRLGSRSMPDTPAEENSPFVEQFLSTGVVLMGNTTLPEFGLTASTEPLLTGTTRNPWSLDHSTGGSSGGSAALVAAGVVPIAHANDGGGSIRIPAACCGLVGLKPSRGRIRQIDTPLPVDIVANGVVSRTVRDTAMFLHGAELAHANPDLPAIGHVTDPLDRPLRIGMYSEAPSGVSFDSRCNDETARIGALLEGLGHRVEAIGSPFARHLMDDFILYWAMSPTLIYRAGKRVFGDGFDRDQLEPWAKYLMKYFNRRAAKAPGAIRRLKRFADEYRAIFETYDVILAPTTGGPIHRLGDLAPTIPGEVHMDRVFQLFPITPMINAGGGPAVSLPLGTTSAGLPLGIHFAADLGQEALLLELSLQLEQAAGWPTLAEAAD